MTPYMFKTLVTCMCMSVTANGTQQDLSAEGGAAEHTDLSASQEPAPEPEDLEPEVPPPTAVS